ncbi:hypothetical protein FPV58_26660 [Mycolicibacterium porcinum]|uniref:hypothetical protein n=1 Tax=Mycolicibacterium porcinum TaxID=39693 RepID=UPI00119555B2|nr:hypothetical protein [Mycolicibacterium porcinum]TVX95895.1 hypothetical protein FPV58_26660 [Mycolicibacterium porcinum]
MTISALFAGSQIARARGQDVDWYTGFGQWLGALASFVAAGAALWISLSDRRYNMAERKRAEEQQDTDLNRQAGMVRVTAKEYARRQAAGPNFKHAAIGIRNRRSDRIFDIDLVKLVHHGEEIEMADIDRINGFAVFPRRPEHEKRFPLKGELDGIALLSDEMLVLYHSDSMPGSPADYAAVRYTDAAGRRWEVDTDGAVTRL